MQRFFRVLSFLIVMFFCSANLFAVTVKVKNLRIEASGKPGEIIEGVFEVGNNSLKQAQINMSMQDFSWDMDRIGIEPKPFNTQKDSCASWIRFLPATLNVKPQEQVKVRYTIEIPTDVQGAEYYAMLFVEKSDPSTGVTDSFSLKAKTRVGIFVKVRIDSLVKPSGEVLEDQIQVIQPQNDDELFKIQFAFKNTGNTLQKVNGSFTIIDKQGGLFGRGTLNRGVAPVGKTVKSLTNWDGELDEGNYDLIMELKYEPEQVFVKEIPFSVSEGS